jgi:hypothetical protein
MLKSTEFDHGYNSVISEDHAAQLNVLLDHYDELQRDRERVSQDITAIYPTKLLLRAMRTIKAAIINR